jgi:hypothetical protein
MPSALPDSSPKSSPRSCASWKQPIASERSRPIPARRASANFSDAQRWLLEFRFHGAAVREFRQPLNCGRLMSAGGPWCARGTGRSNVSKVQFGGHCTEAAWRRRPATPVLHDRLLSAHLLAPEVETWCSTRPCAMFGWQADAARLLRWCERLPASMTKSLADDRCISFVHFLWQWVVSVVRRARACPAPTCDARVTPHGHATGRAP